MSQNKVHFWIFCWLYLMGTGCRPRVEPQSAIMHQKESKIEKNATQENSEQENSEQENSEQENSEQENSEQENSELDAIGEGRAAAVGDHLIGSMAPAVTLRRLDGASVSLKNWLGTKPIYLKFWATWCEPCREQMAHFESVHQSYGEQLAVIGINAGLHDSPAEIVEFQREHPMTMPVMIDEDGSIARAFHLRVTPQHVLIDRHGQIVHVGHLAQPSLDAKIAELIRGDISKPWSQITIESTPSPALAPIQLEPLALLGGDQFDLTSERKQPVLLSFFATWCDWYLEDKLPKVAQACTVQQTRMNALYQKYKDRAQWIGVAQSLWTDETQVEAYRKNHAVPFPLGLDTHGDWFAKFGVRQFPMTVLLDAQGTEIARMKGDPVELEAFLQGQMNQ